MHNAFRNTVLLVLAKLFPLFSHFQKFQRYTISRVCLDCMLTVPESLDRHITRMAVAIVSVLACKVSPYICLHRTV